MMQRYRIRTRLMAGFLAVAILLGAGALVGVWRLTTLNEIIDQLVTDDAAKLSIAQTWEKHVAVNLVRTHTALLLDDKALVSELRREMDVTSTEITKRQKEIEAMAAAGEEQSALEAIGAARNKYRTQRDELLKRRQAGENVREELSNSLEPLGRSYLTAVGGFVEIQERELANAQKAADEAVRRSRALVITLMVVGFGLAIVAATLIARSITGPVTRTRESALRISQGDLSEHLQSQGRDEVSEMVTALGSMQDSLRAIAEKVRGSADAVSTAATQIAVGNTDLSSRTEEQATSLEETAASIEEMTATVNQNAQNAHQANEVAASAARIAQRGGEAVDDVVRTMVSIQQSARKIGDIIGVIDSIAFQTNILALNAAVEAARAGDQGRGFAVVASEVRSLAQRSAGAAKEIKTLITDSVGRIDAGAKTADDTGQTMREVVDSVRRVSTIIGEIAAATKEQSSGIAMVNQAVAELDKATQLNASLVQESTAASEALRNLATDMVATAAVFRTEAQAPAPAPALPRPSARPAKRAAMKPKALAAAGHDDWTEF